MDKVSMSHLISFSRYQTKCIISSYLDNWWHINFKIVLGSTYKAMADEEKKRGRWNTKI